MFYLRRPPFICALSLCLCFVKFYSIYQNTFISVIPESDLSNVCHFSVFQMHLGLKIKVNEIYVEYNVKFLLSIFLLLSSLVSRRKRIKSGKGGAL